MQYLVYHQIHWAQIIIYGMKVIYIDKDQTKSPFVAINFFCSLNIYCNRWISVRIFFKYSYTKNDFNKYILSENINWSLKILHRSIYFRIVSSPDDFLGGLSEDTINPRSLDLFEYRALTQKWARLLKHMVCREVVFCYNFAEHKILSLKSQRKKGNT